MVVNLNDMVKAKLTERGSRIFRLLCPHYVKGGGNYFEAPLWAFAMHVGPLVHMGMSGDDLLIDSNTLEIREM